MLETPNDHLENSAYYISKISRKSDLLRYYCSQEIQIKFFENVRVIV